MIIESYISSKFQSNIEFPTTTTTTTTILQYPLNINYNLVGAVIYDIDVLRLVLTQVC